MAVALAGGIFAVGMLVMPGVKKAAVGIGGLTPVPT